MYKNKYIVLYNPSSGNGKSIKSKKKIINLLKQNGIEYDLYITKSEAHLRELTGTSVNNYDTIIGIGGDTTIKIIAEELFKFDDKENSLPSLAMIGTGSVNDIMRSLELCSVKKAIDVIKTGTVAYMDIGQVKINSESRVHHFLGSMSLGLGTSVNKYVEAFNKKHMYIGKTGRFGQFIAGFFGVRNSFKRGSIPMSVFLEYENIKIKKEFSLLAVLNTSYFAKGLKFVDECSPFDGKMNCTLINTSSFADTLSFYKNLEKKRKEIFSVESDKIIMKFDEATSVQLDGDVFENIKQLDISIIPKKLKIIIPYTKQLFK